MLDEDWGRIGSAEGPVESEEHEQVETGFTIGKGLLK